jgi:hypothetical protein
MDAKKKQKTQCFDLLIRSSNNSKFIELSLENKHLIYNMIYISVFMKSPYFISKVQVSMEYALLFEKIILIVIFEV